jgi:AAA+ ATPase superfamily predicted ATPase
VFDREREWDDLTRFARGPGTDWRIGIVYGRRRMGKTFLLGELSRIHGAFYYQALEEERAPALRRIGEALGRDRRVPGGTLTFSDWPSFLDALASTSGAEARLVVLDEFPYLAANSRELPSAIQAAYDASARERRPGLRLIVCGSAVSVMSGLLTGQRALRGRASLDLVVKAFDFRQAAAFWRVERDPQLAFRLWAVVGGTPGYRRLVDGPPASLADFDQWIARTVLNPAHALFHEAEYLLAEEPTLTDRALYQSAFSAIASGSTTPGAVAAALGRRETSITHVIAGLARAGFVDRDEDLLRQRRPVLRIADPILRFHHAVVRPALDRFERGEAEAWSDAQARFRSNVLGPAFEQLAREWVATYASTGTLGGPASQVGRTVVNDAVGRSQLELNVVVSGHRDSPNEQPEILLIGEAKLSGSSIGLPALRRLARARELLARRGVAGTPRLALFTAGQFAPALRREARTRPDVKLVDLERLYTGD